VTPRRYFRHAQTGDKGFLVQVDGEDRIQYERGAHVETVKYIPAHWNPADDERPLTMFHIGQLAYQCDVAVCKIAGIGPRLRKEWLALSDGERSTWTANGPPKGDLMRRMMFESVQAFGKVFSR
jgi:hypothetical protein